MPRKALSRSSLVAALILFSVLGGGPVCGQSALPAGAPEPGFQGFNTAGAAVGATGPTIPGTGNPFTRRGFPRATLMAPQGAVPINYDAALTPVAFDQPLDTPPHAVPPTMPTGAAPVPPNTPGQPNNFVPPNHLAQPNNVTPPTPSVLPNYSDVPAASAPPGVLVPDAAAPLPTVSSTPVPEPSVPQPGLQGVALLRSLTQAPPGAGHPLLPILQWCDGALQQMEGLADYTCTFKKREFVDGKMQEQQSMYIKSRPRPLSVYLHFLAPRDIHGQEAIYVEGRNEGRLLAHPVGIKKTLVGTVSLEPTHPQAMEGNRHPISDFGIRRLCERYREGLQHDLQFGECDLRIMDNVLVEGRPCVCIQISHPVPRQEFKFNVTRLFVDAEWNLPCRFEAYAWPSRPGEQPMLVEEYTYGNLKLNVGLTEADFDVRNPQYRF